MDNNFLKEKIQNFKDFLHKVCKNKEDINKYANISYEKMLIYISWFLVPRKDDIDKVVQDMQDHLDFDDEHKPKMKKYIQCFIESVSGEKIDDDDNLDFLDRLKKLNPE